MPQLYSIAVLMYDFCDFFQHPFIREVSDNQPLIDLYRLMKTEVVEVLEDLPEDTDVRALDIRHFNPYSFLINGFYRSFLFCKSYEFPFRDVVATFIAISTLS